MKCRDCANQAENNRTLCRKCLDRVKNRAMSLRKNAIEAGLCGKCKVNKKVTDETRCQDCINAECKYGDNRRKKLLSENKCSKCGRPKSLVGVWTNHWCAKCHLKYKLKYDVTHEQAEKLINGMLEVQSFRCALTGRDLKTHKYHIDHIIPKTTAPERISDPTNWQLVVEEVNVFKTDMSIEEIIKLAKDISSYRG